MPDLRNDSGLLTAVYLLMCSLVDFLRGAIVFTSHSPFQVLAATRPRTHTHTQLFDLHQRNQWTERA